MKVESAKSSIEAEVDHLKQAVQELKGKPSLKSKKREESDDALVKARRKLANSEPRTEVAV